MSYVLKTVLVLLLLIMLVACPVVTDNNPPPPPPLITPVGTNVGSPVTQAISAAGGIVTTGTIKVSAPAGAFSSANITLQPITDTLNGSGQGIAISSDAAWDKYLTVTFPIDSSDESPDGLGLAVQQPNGSWLAIEPVKVDKVAGTISAGLPAVTSRNRSALSARGGLDLKRVIKFLAFYIKPKSATVKVKESVTFVPYARVLERPKDCKPAPPNPSDDLANLNPLCWKGVTNVYPFTNEKAGFSRMWTVNGIQGGDATVGKISPNSPSGATYTAPDNQPSPNTVKVGFVSINDAEFRGAPIEPALVTVVGRGYKVVGDFTSTGYPACAAGLGIADLSDHIEFVLTPTVAPKFKAEEIKNQASDGNDTFRSNYGQDVTRNSLTEVLTMNTGSATEGPEGIIVLTEGKSTTGGCTLAKVAAYPGLTYDTEPSFQFDPNTFVNDTQKVSVDDGFGIWKYTITKL